MKKFKKKIMGLMILIYMITAVLVLFLLNFSYIQNNKNSISKILNMKFQIASSQSESSPGKVLEMPEENEAPKAEDIKRTDKEEQDSYIEKSYLAAKSEDGTLYIKNMLPDGEISEEDLIKITENILATQKNSGSYQNYQFEISVHEGELLIAFADITSLRQEEEKYFMISFLVALVLGIFWLYPAWKIAGKMVAPLEEAIRLQKEFVMFAGHELKTPVTVMKASLDMLKKESIHSKYLNYVSEENEKMRRLVMELLDYSKLEYQKEKKTEEKVDLSQCIEGISLEFEAVAFEKEVVLISEIQEDLCVAGNEEQLQRMAETLLENAIRHTNPGEEVKLILWKEGKKALLSVENQGIAIPEEERSRIFEKFYRSSDSEEGHYGLGLAIAQSIAGQHHSEITVYSENGWNCFQVSFSLLHEKQKK